MWHSTEVSRILKSMTEKYGYKILQNRKQCVAFCGDLLAKYELEKRVFQMLFYTGLGEVLAGVPYRSEQDLNRGLFAVEKFLRLQAIDQEMACNIIEVIRMTFIDDTVDSKESFFKPIISKTFKDIHFAMMLPTYTCEVGRIDINSTFKYHTSSGEVDSVLEKCVITDRMGNLYVSNMDYSVFPHFSIKNFCISVQTGDNRVSLKDSKIEFTFLCSDKRKIIISYVLPDSKSFRFENIQIINMSESEYEVMTSIFILLIKYSEKEMTDTIDDNNQSYQQESIYTSPNIEEYSEAIRKEIYFLKQGKGKKYKVINGEKLHRDSKGVYTYKFEMETELHLPDDAPVTIETANGFQANGTVLVCEDFQIMLQLDRDINDVVNVAYITVEPWKLLEALDKRMNSLNSNKNYLAIKLMDEGPGLATNEDIMNVPKGQDEVVRQLQSDDILAVWGPPGTGKTFTMANIAIDYLLRGKSVLIVSHSNVSVDGVIKKIIDLPIADMSAYLKEGKILRFGYVRDEELANQEYATSFGYALTQNPKLKKELETFTKKREALKAVNQTKTDEYHDIEKQIKKIRELIRKEERKYVEKSQLIGTTISRATVDVMFENQQYDLVMFDEVSMAYVPQVIVAAALAKEKFICVGDFKQLSPIAQSPSAKQILQTDIFSYLRIVDDNGRMYSHPWLVMLNEQRRMHPDISTFPNKYVYKNLLTNHDSVVCGRSHIVNDYPLPGDALSLIDLTSSYCAASKNNDNSRFNILSAIVSFLTATNADKMGNVDSVGIITPYAAQTRLIRAMIRDYYKRGTEIISCATVHQFQGSESDVLIFDAVESYPTNRVGFLMGKDMNAVTRLVNVAITRAKGKLVTVANRKFWMNTFKGSNHIFYKLLEYILGSHKVVNNAKDNMTLKTYVESINPNRMIKIFTDEQLAIEQFERDMVRTKGRFMMSIPDGELHETHEQILDIVEDAESRGVNILMKCNEYDDLPEAWKKYCVNTENATFPLMVLDDQVLWYGLPTSKLKFKLDKSTTHFTADHIMVRIDGKNTIEMIKSLTNLEVVEVNGNKKTLSVKENKNSASIINENNSHDDASPGDLAGFIEEHILCPKCNNHYNLTKNQKGTVYLRCSNSICSNSEFLKTDVINMYINVYNVCCPRDGGTIKGLLGKYGPYVRCSHGHFMGPNEI